MNQDSLFDKPRARRSDPGTSKAAAARVSARSNAITGQILDLLGRYPYGLTKDEVCRGLGVDARYWPTVASALSRLRRKGWLFWDGEEDGQHVWRLGAEVVPVEVAGEVL